MTNKGILNFLANKIFVFSPPPRLVTRADNTPACIVGSPYSAYYLHKNISIYASLGKKFRKGIIMIIFAAKWVEHVENALNTI